MPNQLITPLPSSAPPRRKAPPKAGPELLRSAERDTRHEEDYSNKTAPAAGGTAMEKDYLILKRASASRPSGEWSDDDYDVLADSVVVGRIFKANAAPVGEPWVWTLAFGHHE